MATATAQPQATYDEWRTRRWRLTARFFALAWLVLALSVVLTGERDSDLVHLENGLEDGSVSQVEVVGFHELADGEGITRVTLRWHGRLISRSAEVEVDTRRDAGAGGTSSGIDRIVGDPAEHLRRYDPDVAVTYTERHGGSYLDWRGWRAPGWTALLGFATWFGTVLLAGNGPEPWRATKWAWIWLTLFGGPLGCTAYLLAGGPLGLLRPRDLDRRLTGGWAFLLAMALFGGNDPRY